jgi:hypothetical protein
MDCLTSSGVKIGEGMLPSANVVILSITLFIASCKGDDYLLNWTLLYILLEV